MNSILFTVAIFGIACLLVFGISFIFSGLLGLSRRIFLLPYVVFSSAFLFYFFYSAVPVTYNFWTHNWTWGLLIALIAGVFLVRNIWSQPASQDKRGKGLFFDIFWFGFAYGVIDGLMLNVMPVVVARNLINQSTTLGSFSIILLTAVSAIAASLIITLIYHLGYREFRNKSIMLVLLGNTIITLTFIISGNPIAAVISHTAMHIAAVIRGPETTLQLPPHYEKSEIIYC